MRFIELHTPSCFLSLVQVVFMTLFKRSYSRQERMLYRHFIENGKCCWLADADGRRIVLQDLARLFYCATCREAADRRLLQLRNGACFLLTRKFLSRHSARRAASRSNNQHALRAGVAQSRCRRPLPLQWIRNDFLKKPNKNNLVCFRHRSTPRTANGPRRPNSFARSTAKRLRAGFCPCLSVRA